MSNFQTLVKFGTDLNFGLRHFIYLWFI